MWQYVCMYVCMYVLNIQIISSHHVAAGQSHMFSDQSKTGMVVAMNVHTYKHMYIIFIWKIKRVFCHKLASKYP